LPDDVLIEKRYQDGAKAIEAKRGRPLILYATSTRLNARFLAAVV